MIFITNCDKSTYPALNRAAYLIEHACVPRYVPTYCAEEGQLFEMLAEAMLRNTPSRESAGAR